MNYEDIRQQIVDYAKKMYEEKLVAATSGNISVRIPDLADTFAITPSSESYLSMAADRIVIMKVDGTIIECPNGAKPSSEWRLHASFYKAKKETNAVVHTHSPYATAFAAVRKPIPLVLAEMIPWLGGSVPLANYGPLGSWELANNATKVIGDKGAVLLANHGVTAIADNLPLAYVRASYVEDAAKIIILAQALGKPVEIE